jgi:hypothetical protein
MKFNAMFSRGPLWSPLPVLRERVRVRVLPESARHLRFGKEPSPRPSPGVPGEGEEDPLPASLITAEAGA